MRITDTLQVIVISILILVLSAQNAMTQGNSSKAWLEEVGAKLITFIPKPVPGLVDRSVLNPRDESKAEVGGTVAEAFPVLYRRIEAVQTWWIPDDTKSQQYNALKKRKEDLGKRGDEIARKYKSKPRAQRGELSKDPEYLSVTKEYGQVEKELRSLKGEVENRLTFSILINDHSYGEKVGTLKGYPLYREGRVKIDDVALAVVVGPEDFKNPPLPEGGKRRNEVKSIVVKTKMRFWSTEADLALARQMLEQVDYAGLAKLLTP